jgi:hypothetical protein
MVRRVYSSGFGCAVNNVGTNIRKPTVEYTSAEFQAIFSTNVESAYNLCQVDPTSQLSHMTLYKPTSTIRRE